MSDGFDGLGDVGAEKVVADLQLGSVAGTWNSDAGDRDSFYWGFRQMLDKNVGGGRHRMAWLYLVVLAVQLG